MDRMDKNEKDKEKHNEKYNEKMRRNGEKEFGRDVYGGILDPQNPDDIANYSLNATSDENDYNESVVTYGTGNLNNGNFNDNGGNGNENSKISVSNDENSITMRSRYSLMSDSDSQIDISEHKKTPKKLGSEFHKNIFKQGKSSHSIREKEEGK